MQDRIRLEMEAVLGILDRCSAGEWVLVSSTVVSDETDETGDETRRLAVRALLAQADEVIRVGQPEEERSVELEAIGFRGHDALHLACAEHGRADVFLTTDDRLRRRAARHARQLHVRVENPLAWLQEVTRV
jgi:predicted nucleic acid-binding protein